MSIKAMKALISSVLVAPLVTLLVYYAVSFVPYTSDLKELSMRGLQQVGPVESIAYPLAIAAEGEPLSIRSWAIRQGYYNLDFKLHNRTTLKWHLDNVLWLVASYIHFNDREIFGIWIQCAMSSCADDLNSVAISNFGSDLSALSDSQLADIVASVKSPNIFAPGTERGKERAKDILKRATNT